MLSQQWNRTCQSHNDILKAVDDNSTHRHYSTIALLIGCIWYCRSHDFGIKTGESFRHYIGTLLNWFRSYLQLRKQFVFVNGIDSPLKDLQYGVPQETVLGPLLYSLYTSPLGDIARKHGIPFHLFEVDTPIYIYVSRLHLTALTIHPTRRRQLSCVLKDIGDWMLCVINRSTQRRFPSKYVEKHFLGYPEYF